jgi:hypothetical protein
VLSISANGTVLAGIGLEANWGVGPEQPFNPFTRCLWPLLRCIAAVLWNIHHGLDLLEHQTRRARTQALTRRSDFIAGVWPIVAICSSSGPPAPNEL